jgi:hypothetical protein
VRFCQYCVAIALLFCAEALIHQILDHTLDPLAPVAQAKSRGSSSASPVRSSESSERSNASEGRRSTSVPAVRETERSSESEQRQFGTERGIEDGSERESASTSRAPGLDGNDEEFEGLPRSLGEVLERITQPDRSKSRKDVRYGVGVDSSPRADNEILAVNLSPGGARRAQKLGFNLRGSSLISKLRGTLTRLVPPAGMDAAQAQNLMRQTQPGERFAINQRYHIYQPARKDMTSDAAHSKPAHRGGCARDQCFGSQIIGWNDAMRHCASGLRVGVIDTSVDHAHPAFSRAKIHLGRFLPEGVQPAPAWHGTGVLSVLAGDLDSGTPGLIPDSDFYLASVFIQDEKGEVSTDTLSVLSALDWMSAFDVKIVNMSFSGPRDELIETAIERMSADGVLFVAAVGNDGPTTAPSYPASYPSVVAVTAITNDLRNYPYANRGEKVDAAAPGVDIWSAVPDAREGYHTGTSFAVPYVTAILAAVYQSAHIRKKDELLDRLSVVDLGAAGRDPVYGRGVVLAPKACADSDATVARAEPLAQGSGEPAPRPTVPQKGTAPSSGPLSYR